MSKFKDLFMYKHFAYIIQKLARSFAAAQFF
jgi:hypothetical protein